MTKSILIFLTFFFINIAFTQSPDWQSITNMNDIRDIAIYNDKVWAVSEGGTFIYDPLDESIEKIRSISKEQLMKTAKKYCNLNDFNVSIVGSKRKFEWKP